MARYVAYDTVHAIATEQHGLLKTIRRPADPGRPMDAVHACRPVAV